MSGVNNRFRERGYEAFVEGMSRYSHGYHSESCAKEFEAGWEQAKHDQYEAAFKPATDFDVVTEQPKTGVGDITSDKRGTAARYNADKVKLQYVPMDVLTRMNFGAGNELTPGLISLGNFIAQFEQGRNLAIFDALSLIDLKDICDVFDFGAKKYAAWNWAKGFNWSIPLACIKRHWLALANGEEIDPESGISHVGHIGCNLVMLAHFLVHYPEGDDRPPAHLFAATQTS